MMALLRPGRQPARRASQKRRKGCRKSTEITHFVNAIGGFFEMKKVLGAALIFRSPVLWSQNIDWGRAGGVL